MEPGSYETDTSGMARVHRIVEDALGAGPAYVNRSLPPHKVVAVASFYDNLLDYVHAHHGAEDELLYPRLEERCVDERETIRLVGSQHQLLDEPMTATTDAIARWRADPTADSAMALVSALGALLEVFSPHCRDEETIVMPIAGRYLSPEEWHGLLHYERQHYRLDKPWLMFGLAMERSDDAQREALLASMPESRRAKWTGEWSHAFQLLMADVRP